MGTIRSTIYKQGTRNIMENLMSGLGYEGIIEIYSRNESFIWRITR